MLDIKGLQAGLEDGTEILKGINLSIGAGEVHAIMGPNGSGKSTTANILSGKSGYDVTAGSATLDGADLFEMEPEERAHAGLFQRERDAAGHGAGARVHSRGVEERGGA